MTLQADLSTPQASCWREFMVEDITKAWLEFRVFDHDGFTVEFMGSARLR